MPFDDEFVPDARFLYGEPMARIEVPSFDCVAVTTGDSTIVAATRVRPKVLVTADAKLLGFLPDLKRLVLKGNKGFRKTTKFDDTRLVAPRFLFITA